MTEVVLHQSTELSIVQDQQSFTPAQRTALAHIGVENATDADVQVFFHVVKRTGLDPFAKQIYMIGRKSQGTVKQTIQTGIDGYRLIGRRAANAAGATLSLKPVQWAHKDGGWRDVWMAQWGLPVAARVTIVRSGEEFTATALFDEYKQTKFDGGLTQMWNQRPAGQIAKCAEALAWRMAFPQDLSGIYVDEEMQQADVQRPVQAQANRTAKDAVRAAVAAPAEQQPASDAITKQQTKKLHATFGELGLTDRDERMAWTVKVIGRHIDSSTELTKAEAATVIDALDAEIQMGETKTDAPKSDLDDVRDEILKLAETKGANLWHVEQEFAKQHGGTLFYDGDGEQLATFRAWVESQKDAA